MIIEIETDFKSLTFTQREKPLMAKKLLMVTPQHFNVEYAINPYMKNEKGQLQNIDRELAQTQWRNLKETFEKIGLPVEVIEGQAGLPDMVFCANQSFPFIREGQFKASHSVLLSHMRSQFRKEEVAIFEKYYQREKYDVFGLDDSSKCFEGNGDALLHPTLNLVFGGYGPRTDKVVYKELNERFDLNVVLLELKTEDFYHLDTCLMILNSETAAIQPTAFSETGVKLIKTIFKDVIEVSREENIKAFACNGYCPDGKNVVIQSGAENLNQQLRSRGFTVHEVNTSEFMKSGGSVFCMKMALY
jgi:N-dimethylarginine dimethylaminohydrolase